MSSPKRRQSGSVAEAPFGPEAETGASLPAVGVTDRWQKKALTGAAANLPIGIENQDQTVAGLPGELSGEAAMHIMIYECFVYNDGAELMAVFETKTTVIPAILASNRVFSLYYFWHKRQDVAILITSIAS